MYNSVSDWKSCLILTKIGPRLRQFAGLCVPQTTLDSMLVPLGSAEKWWRLWGRGLEKQLPCRSAPLSVLLCDVGSGPLVFSFLQPISGYIEMSPHGATCNFMSLH